ncbi:MAG: hypothetical protein ACLTKG_05470 [Collinsella intestinalis]
MNVTFWQFTKMRRTPLSIRASTCSQARHRREVDVGRGRDDGYVVPFIHAAMVPQTPPSDTPPHHRAASHTVLGLVHAKCDESDVVVERGTGERIKFRQDL